ncbi:MAG: multiheme c-type cytochrome [Polyangiaceae bacterium]
MSQVKLRLSVSGLYTALLALAVATGGILGASCSTGNGGASTASRETTSAGPAHPTTPTIRLYLLSTIAGALEPCGCSKDQLGGISHLAAYLAAERAKVPGGLVLGAGPLFFMEPELKGDKKNQDEWKGEALAKASAAIGLTAWAPSANEWAGGSEMFGTYVAATKADFLGANLSGAQPIGKSKIVDVNGIKVGIVGVSDPAAQGAKAPAGVTVASAADAMKAEIASLRGQGARVLVGLASLQRGEALRLAEQVGDLDVLLIGKPNERGDVNDKRQPAILSGKTLVVQTSNHMQTLAVVDLFVREPAGSTGPITFADAGGVANSEELTHIADKIKTLEDLINGWEKNAKVDKKDLEERRIDLGNLRARKAQLEAPAAAPSGSFFQYLVVEVRDKLGKDPAADEITLGYYKHVNDFNKDAFKDRVPPPPEPGAPSFVGVERCASCHTEEKAVWDGTAHAHAYATLEKQFVEYNLDCVGCHVTGYDREGGSTVTHVEKLKNVGCEECHGAGSLHADSPKTAGLIQRQPDLKRCVSECHHPPHVDGFDAKTKVEGVLGPGHGR